MREEFEELDRTLDRIHRGSKNTADRVVHAIQGNFKPDERAGVYALRVVELVSSEEAIQLIEAYLRANPELPLPLSAAKTLEVLGPLFRQHEIPEFVIDELKG